MKSTDLLAVLKVSDGVVIHLGHQFSIISNTRDNIVYAYVDGKTIAERSLTQEGCQTVIELYDSRVKEVTNNLN